MVLTGEELPESCHSSLQAIIFRVFLEMVEDYDLDHEVVCLHLEVDGEDLREVEYPSHYRAEIDLVEKSAQFPDKNQRKKRQNEHS